MIIYFLGLLIVNSLLILWFYSPLVNSISKYFLKRNDIFSVDQLADLIAIKSSFFSTLISCWICLSFWLSFIVGLFFTMIYDMPWYYPLLTYFTYPSMLYLVKQLYR